MLCLQRPLAQVKNIPVSKLEFLSCFNSLYFVLTFKMVHLTKFRVHTPENIHNIFWLIFSNDTRNTMLHISTLSLFTPSLQKWCHSGYHRFQCDCLKEKEKNWSFVNHNLPNYINWWKFGSFSDHKSVSQKSLCW